MLRSRFLHLLWDMENSNEKACLCALNRLFGFTPKAGLALISHLGSASDIFRMSPEELEEVLGPYSKHAKELGMAAVEQAAEELHRLEGTGIGFTGWTEEGYPPLLRECEDAPIGLYIRSMTPAEELWKPRRSIAVIGTRDISPYGREWCERMVTELSHTSDKPLIVSGLALGTDICAHKTALETGLPTVAVMATGPETIYPYRHRETAERICSTPGCALITDYPPGTSPLAVNFLRRNRIIAGMSDTTILVESKMKGGGMMTSRLAFSYNREVYALPGRIDDIRSQGCNSLIRSKIAEPVTSLEGLIESLGLENPSGKSYRNVVEIVREAFGQILPDEDLNAVADVLSVIRKSRGITLDDLASACGLGYGKTADAVGMLETEGLISVDLLQRCCINPKKIR